MPRLPPVLLGPLIGAHVRVVHSSDPHLLGLEGRIVFETRTTFDVLTREGVKRVLKRACVFELELRGRRILIDGRLLENRLRRLKKLGRKRR